MHKCADLVPKMKSYGIHVFHKSTTTLSDDRQGAITVFSTYVPFFDFKTNCVSRDLTPHEKSLANSSNNDK
jgi:hypothetical protein